MTSLPTYREHPDYYKQLIAKINYEVNFAMYLNQLGYKLKDKSASSMEFRNEADCIVLNTGRNPVTYFNRNDSTDKGLFFKFLLKRSENFYKAIELGLEISRQIQDFEKDLEISKTIGRKKSLEENYNIVPLQKADYLMLNRGISEGTLQSDPFKERIFNAFYILANGGEIANIAFPKFDLAGKRRNYILYNKPFKNKISNKIRNFRLVLNQEDHFLFYSNPVKGNTVRIVFGESSIDLLSYHEIHGSANNFYVSFGGNVYQEKLEQFIKIFQKFSKKKEVEVLSITDNDKVGFEYDIKVFTSLINHLNKNVDIETKFRKANIEILVHYPEKSREQLSKHYEIFEKKMGSGLLADEFGFPLVNCIRFLNKIVVEINRKIIIDKFNGNNRDPIFEEFVMALNSVYLPFSTRIHKSKGKDWNVDLLESKREKWVATEQANVGALDIGDKIELKTPKGPEGSANIGTIKKIMKNGVVCDFGLRYNYAIPFSSIAKHYIFKGGRIKNPSNINTRKSTNQSRIFNNLKQN